MLNYHFDSITADNGDADFSRVPIEATLFYTGVPQWRFGGGARWVQNPTASIDVDRFATVDIEFKDTVGSIFEVGYHLAPPLWVSLRGVLEDYQAERFSGLQGAVPADPTDSIHGNHIGLFMSLVF
ncbi:MAG: hypothetical protein IPM37_09035 [Hahellaceae bacterium]|nr:hypothetical protein [Hahellaceae bacterium]